MRKVVIFGVCGLAAVVSLLVITALGLVGHVNLDYANKIFVSCVNVDKSREEPENTLKNITYEPFTGSCMARFGLVWLMLPVPRKPTWVYPETLSFTLVLMGQH